MVESSFELFSFEKEQMDSIYNVVEEGYENYQECQRDILLLEKVINTKLDEDLSEMVKEYLKNIAVGTYIEWGTAEHVMRRFCILLEGKLRPEVPNTSGLANLYTRLPIKPEKEIKDMMMALVRQYEDSKFSIEREQAARYKALLNEEYISIMDALDVAFLTTFTNMERRQLGNGKAPALRLYQAMGQPETLLNLLAGKATDWPGKTIDYAFVWLGRNICMREGSVEKIIEVMLKRSYWSTLLDCSARYEKEINERLMDSGVE